MNTTQFLPLSTPKMLVFSKVFSTPPLILHPVPELSLYFCSFILFLMLMIQKDPASPYHTSSSEYSKDTANSMFPEPNSVVTCSSSSIPYIGPCLPIHTLMLFSHPLILLRSLTRSFQKQNLGPLNEYKESIWKVNLGSRSERSGSMRQGRRESQ